MKKKISRSPKKVLRRNQRKSCRLLWHYKEKFEDYPMIPITMPYDIGNDDFKKMCEEAIERGTPLTEEDYERYFPTKKGKGLNRIYY